MSRINRVVNQRVVLHFTNNLKKAIKCANANAQVVFDEPDKWMPLKITKIKSLT